MSRTGRSYWLAEPGSGEIHTVIVPDPGAGEVLVRTLVSGISRGTESLVFRGGVPESQYAAMRAPFQEGDFPGPVKYGYLNVGVVEAGPDDLVGRTVFCSTPTRRRTSCPSRRSRWSPTTCHPRRAVLAGTVETAVNALWDARPLVGDRVAVVGAGMVGLCVARLLAAMPGVTVTVVDVDGSRAEVAEKLGAAFASPVQAPRDLDLVVHASGTSDGLQLSLDLLGADGVVTDLSWYGDTKVELSLGDRFHSARLGIKASQVGEIAEARRGRRTHADRTALALRLLADPAFDALLTGASSFDELPEVMGKLASGSLPALCHTIGYDDPDDTVADRVREP